MRRIALLIAVVACGSGLGLPAADAQNVPRGFVRHAGQYWTWFGPATWVGSYSPYGLTVTSPTGLDAMDYGFSTIPCAPSPATYFARRRNEIRASINLQGTRLFNASPVRQLGVGSYRQTVQFSGSLGGRTPFRGELVLVYALTSPPYCYQSTLARYAPAARYAASIFTLRKIWEFTTYSGPGACLGTGGRCDNPRRKR